MRTGISRNKTGTAAMRDGRERRKEPILAQIASFVDLFVWLLVLKSFFLPLFIIPTGSMAETLAGAHATHACPNCGFEYPIGFDRAPGRANQDPDMIQCPNCRWQEAYRGQRLQQRLRPTAGDRIIVHGWPYEFGGALGPRRWDVVVFKNPNEPQINYIKRLIGLPGEKIEIIDGDIYVNDRIAPKTRHAQEALWFSFYNQDYFPKRPGARRTYHPRWVALERDSGWTGLQTRVFAFDGTERPRAEIQFVTRPNDSLTPGEITDVYGYNAYYHQIERPPPNRVSDVRVSCEVAIEAGEGCVELSTTKYSRRFFARLYADGRVTLEHAQIGDPRRTPWGRATVESPVERLRFALSHADYAVRVEIDGGTVIETNREQYDIKPDRARELAALPSRRRPPPTCRIAAERVRATVGHVLIERDVFYTFVRKRTRMDNGAVIDQGAGNGVQGNPIQLREGDYFVLGDNSPASLDSRYWQEPPGPHLVAALKRGEYRLGTVPADQMIGRAFLVYWPGFLPLTANGPNLLPNLGRVRWIH